MRDVFGREVPRSAFIIRATEVAQFLNCPRQWLILSHNGLNLEPRTSNPNLRFGTCWHKALEYHYNPNLPWGVESARLGFSEAVEHELERMHRLIGDGVYDPEFQEAIKEDVALANALLEEYVPWSVMDADPPDRAFQVVALEERFVVPVISTRGNRTRAYLAVRLDGLVRYNSALYVLEHKSMSKSSSVDNPNNLPLDLQMGLQLLATRAAFGSNSPVHGAIYNLTRKQAPSARVKAPLFGRHVVRRSARELDLLRDFLYRTYQAMRQAAVTPLWRSQYNPQMVGKCSWGCDARMVCEAITRGEDYQGLLDTTFRPREKDIFQTLEEEMQDS